MLAPFYLRHRPTPARAAGLWLASADGRHLAGLWPRLRGEWPEVYALAGGFLVLPVDPPPAALPRAIRLRRLAGNLYLPVDADLAPALHPAEAADLTSARGLVFLPGQVLAFDPGRPRAVAEVVAPAAVRRAAWEPFPPRPERADRLVAIRLEGPSEPVAILEQGRPVANGGAGESRGEATDPNGDTTATGAGSLRPPDSAPLWRAAGRAAFGGGKFLAWLGRMLRWPRLAKAGANLIRRAVERVPRLTEKILGRQEASLGQLLRRFQAGDIEGGAAACPRRGQ